jgi:ubiquinone/menaquinone biosynthesis C-methylase UbiE
VSIKSKAWNWKAVKIDTHWKEPAKETYWLLDRWKKQGRKDFFDLGAGLGRHSIQFAKQSFRVSGLDLSSDSAEKASNWAKEEAVKINFTVGDMLNLPYEDDSFDCLLAYFAISHTDTEGMRKIASEMHRVLRKNGEFYVTLGSKKSSNYQKDWPKVDENTNLRMEKGSEYKVPHFYADYDLVFDIFQDFEIMTVEEKQETFKEPRYDRKDKYGMVQRGWQFHILGKKQ